VLQRSCAVLLVAALLALVPAAYADPPDPTWIGGYWDDDDFDNVAIFIVSACAVEVPSLTVFGPVVDASRRHRTVCRRGLSRSRLTPLLPPARRQYSVPARVLILD